MYLIMRKIISFSIIQQLLYHFTRVESLTGDNFTPIRAGEFPFIASLQYFPEEDNFCVGALISKKHVLTSAHCLHGVTPVSFRIVFEVARRQEIALAYSVASWTTYASWAERQGIPHHRFARHNIAIVKLTDKVYHVNPVPLNGLTKRQLYGKVAILTGWQNDVLSKATVNLLNDVDCGSRVHVISDQTAVNNKTLCSTANPHALLDNEDGGSPLLDARGEGLLGVAFGRTPLYDHHVNGNFTIEFIRQHQVNVHISIDYYRTFIFSVVPAAPGA